MQEEHNPYLDGEAAAVSDEEVFSLRNFLRNHFNPARFGEGELQEVRLEVSWIVSVVLFAVW